ncbi:MAG: hypothetical protein ACLFR0_02225 [Alphaproteobacteria bacterium]
MNENRKAYRITVFISQDALDDFIAAIQDKIPAFDAPYDRVMWWSEPRIEAGTEQFRALKGAQPASGHIGETKRIPTTRLEFLCPYKEKETRQFIINILKPAHPFNDPVIYYEEIIWPENTTSQK